MRAGSSDQTVEEGGGDAPGARLREIAGVGFEHLGRALAQSARRGHQGARLRLGWRIGELTGGGARFGADGSHGGAHVLRDFAGGNSFGHVGGLLDSEPPA